MPPRYSYWTIIAGGLPTAFRAAEREELLPTFQRIREKHPDAQMKWFARGKLWESPEAARVRADEGRGRRPSGDSRAGAPRDRDRQDADRRDRDRQSAPPAGENRDRPRPDEAAPPSEKRGRDWRPGGEHRDPRQKFVDAKKQKNAALRQDRWQKKNAPPRERPHGPPPREDDRREPARDARPPAGRPPNARPPSGSAPTSRPPYGSRPDARPPYGSRPNARPPYDGSRPGATPPPESRRPDLAAATFAAA